MDRQFEEKVKKAEEENDRPEWENHVAATFKGIRSDWKRKAQDFPSAEFRMHTRAARREMLMAFRSLIDAAIAHLEEQEKPAPAEPKAGRVTVE